MIKVYRCVSEISFNLNVRGSKRRINFDPMSGGKSQYRTNDPDEQDGIEKLGQFGGLICLHDSIEEVGDLPENKDDGGDSDEMVGGDGTGGDGGEAGADGGNQDGDDEKTGKDVQGDIVSFADAKEYLLTHGCAKTIRSREHIVAYAAELGVEFPNLK